MKEVIKAPFTEEQVELLNTYQDSGIVHPYTCGEDNCRSNLKASAEGWLCVCGYKQDWACSSLLNIKEFIQQHNEVMDHLRSNMTAG